MTKRRVSPKTAIVRKEKECYRKAIAKVRNLMAKRIAICARAGRKAAKKVAKRAAPKYEPREYKKSKNGRRKKAVRSHKALSKTLLGRWSVSIKKDVRASKAEKAQIKRMLDASAARVRKASRPGRQRKRKGTVARQY